MTTAVKNIQSLTPLRGVAALIVAIHHFNGFLYPHFGEAVAEYTLFFKRGYLWVDFFFMLSGFILTHVYLKRFENGFNWKNYYRFIYSRFSRIYPLHLVMLIIFAGLVIIKVASIYFSHNHAMNALQLPEFGSGGYGVYSAENFIKNLFLVQSLTFSQLTSWNQPSWSLSVEWAAYFIFPLYVSAVYRLPSVKRAISALLLMIGIYLLLRTTEGHLDIEGFYGLTRCLLEAALGVIAYRIYTELPQKHILGNEIFFVFILTASIFVMSFPTNDAFVIPFLFLTLISAAQAKGRVIKAINSKPMVFLGNISFAIYMTNWFIVIAARKVFGRIGILDKGMSLVEGFVILLLFLLLVIVVSAVMYRYVEKPSQSFLKKGLMANPGNSGTQ